MNKFAIVLLSCIMGVANAQTPPTPPPPPPIPEIVLCSGKFALCAASTCTLTGKTIKTNNGVTYPEVKCTCPVLEGKAIADLTGGNMAGSCAAPMVDGKEGVWSLFAPKVHYPQEASNFKPAPPSATKATVQACSGKNALGSTNCFSMACSYGKVVNGTQTADCLCPIGQIKEGTEFLTEAGQGDPAVCTQHPVAAPNPLDYTNK